MRLPDPRSGFTYQELEPSHGMGQGSAHRRWYHKGRDCLFGAGITGKTKGQLEMLPAAVREGEKSLAFPPRFLQFPTISHWLNLARSDWQRSQKNVGSHGPFGIEEQWGMHGGASKQISTRCCFYQSAFILMLLTFFFPF